MDTDTEAKPLAAELQGKVDKRVDQYIRIRDALKVLEEKYETERAPLVEMQNLLTGWMMEFLDKAGASAVKTKYGTCHTSTRYTASLADPDAFMKFVIANNKFELLDRRANATAVRDYVAENKALPPGTNLNSIRTLGVRRK